MRTVIWKKKSSKQKDLLKLNENTRSSCTVSSWECVLPLSAVHQDVAGELTLALQGTSHRSCCALPAECQLSASVPAAFLFPCNYCRGRAEITLRNQTVFVVRDYFLILTGDSNATECLTGTEESTFSVEENPSVSYWYLKFELPKTIKELNIPVKLWSCRKDKKGMLHDSLATLPISLRRLYVTSQIKYTDCLNKRKKAHA